MRGQEFEYGDHEMQKGASAVWSAANAAGIGARADERVGRGLSFWDDVRAVGTGSDEIAAGISDCEVMREVEGGRWQRLNAEFEQESRNFLIHKHDPNECDMLICWVHNWPECPEWIEVVELSREVRKLIGRSGDRA
jgi:hypothetical protein